MTPKALYIRIPKNGSISMFGVIRGFPEILSKSRRYYPTEINNPVGLGKEYLESFGPIDLSKLFIYSFVRNPFSRAVSSWRFTSYKKGESFEDFVEIYQTLPSGTLSNNGFIYTIKTIIQLQITLVE